MELIRSEVRAQVRTYSAFIFFAAIFGAPVLFAVSVYLVNVLSIINPVDPSTLPREAARNLPFMSLSASSYDVSFLRTFCLVNIAIISIFAGMLIGLIERGKAIRGLSYIPIFLILSFGLFFLTTNLVANLSGIVTGWTG